ncbi:MAG: VOC family protein [Phycicoccus sp.]|nr:VOC family protein [Phycicoccus sp.]
MIRVVLTAAVFDAHDPQRVAQFWSALLRREVTDDPRGPLIAGLDSQLGLRFVASTTAKVAANRMHLHLTSASPTAQRDTVARAGALGARHIDVGQRPEEGHIVLADPEGGEFCVLEAGNAFTAGAGFLGELGCEGTRAVGQFWSEALGWPLVWDQDGETAIQSPGGGTIVAWGGPPVAPHLGPHRQRLELAVPQDAWEHEIGRLIGLGATRLPSPHDGVAELTDPDGNPFVVTESPGMP